MNQLADVLGAREVERGADLFTTLIQRAPRNFFYHGSLATLLAARGDLENYRRCCQGIVARFGATTELFIGFRMAERCSILPSAGVDPEAVGKMADVAAAAGPTNRFFAYFQCTKGLPNTAWATLRMQSIMQARRALRFANIPATTNGMISSASSLRAVRHGPLSLAPNRRRPRRPRRGPSPRGPTAQPGSADFATSGAIGSSPTHCSRKPGR